MVRVRSLRMGVWIVVLGLVAGTAGVLFWRAQAPRKAARMNIQAIGPQVGSTVQDFTLPDQDGTPRRLRSLFGPRGMLLVFSRSADW